MRRKEFFSSLLEHVAQGPQTFCTTLYGYVLMRTWCGSRGKSRWLSAEVTDKGRGGEAAVPSDPTALFAGMFEHLSTDRLWAGEYEDFVQRASFAERGELIGFDQALSAPWDVVALLGRIAYARLSTS